MGPPAEVAMDQSLGLVRTDGLADLGGRMACAAKIEARNREGTKTNKSLIVSE